ncbi:MAG: phosphatase PAP2 family protein [Methyloligellaceae bacterium]
MTDLSTVRHARSGLVSRGTRFAPGSSLLTRNAGSTVRSALRAHRAFLTIVASYLVCGLAVAAYLGRSIGFDLGIDFTPVLLLLAAVMLGVGASYLIYVQTVLRPQRMLRHCLTTAKEHIALSPRLGNALSALLGTAGLLVVTTYLRLMLPELNFFAWDSAFTSLDKALHLGVHPWQITHAFAGSAVATYSMDLLYRAGIVWALLIWFRFAFAPDVTPLGRRFFIAFALIWAIGGGLLSVGFSAAGPAYYAFLVPGSSPYAPLFDALAVADRTLDLWSLGAQEGIWAGFTGAGSAYAAAISAMPSLTCAMLALVTAATYQMGKWLGHASSAMTVMSGVAAVHLGWNYAIDCYAGALLGLGMWSLAGLFAKGHTDQDADQGT